MFEASRQSPLLPSLRDSMKAERLPSAGVTQLPRYFTPLRLLARPTQISVALIPSRCGHHPRRTRSPALPDAASPACRPDDPGEPICSCISYLYRWRRPSPYVQRVGTLYLSIHEALWVSCWYGLWICDPPFIKSFLDPLSPESRPSKPDLRYRGVPIIPRAGL